MTLSLVLLASLVPLALGLEGLTVTKETDDCDLEISFKDIILFCHTEQRPAFSMGSGEFQAADHLGNFDLNDTILKKVDLVSFTVNLPTIELFNEEEGVGLTLTIDENAEEGLFDFSFSFPSKFYPAVQDFNRL